MLIEPFGMVKELKQVRIDGHYDADIEKSLREKLAVPNRSAEDCLDEAFRLKEEGNKLLMDEKNPRELEAIKCYEASFRAMHIICQGRRRFVWGERYFDRDMAYGIFKGHRGQMACTVMRVKLVANIVFAYLRLENFEEAHFWGMRTVNILRANMHPDREEAILDFPAANELGKIYYRTGVAAKRLGRRDEARCLLKVAMDYLPNDSQIKQEHANVVGRIA